MPGMSEEFKERTYEWHVPPVDDGRNRRLVYSMTILLGVMLTAAVAVWRGGMDSVLAIELGLLLGFASSVAIAFAIKALSSR